MTAATRLWLQIGLATSVSLALLLLVAPPRPAVRLPWGVAGLGGVVAGILLYVAVTRCRPCLPARRQPVALAFAAQAILGLLATNEEVVWRRVVLGELLETGAITAVVASTVGFALVHRSRRKMQLATGAVFGALYLLTGALAASVAAHWVYNALVGALLDRRRASRVPA